MSKLVGMAPRSWVDKRTGSVQERTVLWLERHDVRDLVGQAYDEVMVHPDLITAGTKLGDDLLIERNSSGFVQQVLNLTILIADHVAKGK